MFTVNLCLMADRSDHSTVVGNEKLRFMCLDFYVFFEFSKINPLPPGVTQIIVSVLTVCCLYCISDQ